MYGTFPTTCQSVSLITPAITEHNINYFYFNKCPRNFVWKFSQDIDQVNKFCILEFFVCTDMKKMKENFYFSLKLCNSDNFIVRTMTKLHFVVNFHY